jgi:hypothetical protein
MELGGGRLALREEKTGMSVWNERLTAAVICLAALLAPCGAQEADDERWDPGHGEACWFDYSAFTRRDAEIVRERWREILEESRASGDEWAGEYTSLYADTSLTKLFWAPSAGYAFVYVWSCGGGILEVGYGGVERSPSLVRLLPERVGTTRYARRVSSRLVPVRWGAWQCLVPEDELKQFCESAAGRDDRSGGTLFYPSGFVKSHGDGERGEGLPVVPPEYRHLVLEPLRARVIALEPPYVRRNEWDDEASERVVTVVLDVGSAEGAKPGIVLHVVGSEGETAQIVEVGKHTSRAEIVRRLDEEDVEEIPIGRELTTRPFDLEPWL